jgi:plasmid stabilization system protein ParE
MTRVLVGERVRLDLMRLVDFLAEQDPAAALASTDLIVGAPGLLQHHPRIGRRVEDSGVASSKANMRELVIQRGRSGYLALYRVDAQDQIVEVLAIRHQRESGYHPVDL